LKNKQTKPNIDTTWYIYIIECSDGTLYTGITNNISRRLEQHNKGKASKYTRTRTPVKLKALFKTDTRSSASKEEYRIKHLSRIEKLKLCKKQST
jgi:putative endonuclease